MSIRRRFAIAGLTLLVIGVLMLQWQQHGNRSMSTSSQKAAVQQKTAISYRGVEGKNALSLLKSSHAVVTKSYSFGDMVESIDGVDGTGPKYWTLYVNGKMSDSGASAYVTKTGDTIEWKLEQQ